MSDETPDGEVKDPVDAGDDQKVVIGDEELTPDEAKDLVESGKSLKALREKYPDIDFEELPKSFTQTRQELAELKKPKAPEKPLEPDEEARRKQINDFFRDPLVREHLKKMTKEDDQQLREDLEFQKVVENLEAEFNGEDGRPKFVKLDVLKHGAKPDVQIFNPRKAYLDLHQQSLDEWKLKKANEKKSPSTFFEKRGGQGAKLPDAKSPTTFKEAREAAEAELE